MPSSESIIQLRQILAERFPCAEVKTGLHLETGLPRLDEPLGGGLAKGVLTELTAGPSTGSALLLHGILRQAARHGHWIALVDGSDGFDPAAFEQAVLDHLLWIRCRHTPDAIQCTDLLLRDGNLPLVILDLQQNAGPELRQIPGTLWYRLQRIVEQSAVACLVITPRVLVSSAQTRLVLDEPLPLEAFDELQEKLLAQLPLEIVRRTAPQRLAV